MTYIIPELLREMRFNFHLSDKVAAAATVATIAGSEQAQTLIRTAAEVAVETALEQIKFRIKYLALMMAAPVMAMLTPNRFSTAK
jgi:hypothetical protein